MPYTSANGYMFSQINKEGDIGIRLPESISKELIEAYAVSEFKSYGAAIKDYIKIPESLLDNPDKVSKLLLKGQDYVMSLKPKNK